jgi:osmotically-inducible protein OsmY
MNKDQIATRRVAPLLAALLAVTLAACGNKANDTTAGQKVDSAGARTEQAAKDANAKAQDVARAVEAKVDDATITTEVNAGLAKDTELSAIKIDVDTKGGTVLLKGPAPTAAAKARATEIAKSVKGVGSVDNQLEVKSM